MPHDLNHLEQREIVERIESGDELTRSYTDAVRWDGPTAGERAEGDEGAQRPQAPNGRQYDIRVLMSTETVAADGGIIRTDGWELDRFQSNPVTLLFHDRRSFAVGRVVDLEIDGVDLVGYIEFDDEDETARKARSKYQRGFMRAVSVGFLPLEVRSRFRDELTTEEIEQGAIWVSDQTELLELSLVSVPSLAPALTFDEDEGETREEAQSDADRDPADRREEGPASERTESDESSTRADRSEGTEKVRTELVQRLSAIAIRAKRDAHQISP